MKITFLGTGGASPPSGRAQTGIILEEGDRCLLLDCGSGVLLRLDQAGIDPARLNTILVSHTHLDHVSDLLPLVTTRWLTGHTRTRIYGPEGTAYFVRDWLKHFDYVRKHVDLQICEVEGGARFEADGFRITCLRTDHGEVPARAYKFNDRIVVSGDTAPIPEMAEFARGCELLVHECSFPDGHEAPNHTTPRALGRLIAESNLKKLVLTHFYPQVEGGEQEMIRSVKGHFAGDVRLAEDLMSLEI